MSTRSYTTNQQVPYEQMNAATQAALANFLAHGNNQMGG
jgi:hypothetical protein